VLFLPSDDWHRGYRNLAASVPDFDYLDAVEAIEIARRLVGPVISGLTSGTWDPIGLEWKTP